MLALLAWIILAAPWEPPDWLVENESVWNACVARAKEEEVWSRYDGMSHYGYGPGEGMPTSRPGAVWWWRWRLREMAECPHLCDLQLFPLIDHASCKVIVEPLWARLEELGRCKEGLRQWAEYVGLTPEQERLLAQWEAEKERLAKEAELWGWLLSALETEGDTPMRRYSLQELRKLAGPANYYAGRVLLAK